MPNPTPRYAVPRLTLTDVEVTEIQVDQLAVRGAIRAAAILGAEKATDAINAQAAAEAALAGSIPHKGVDKACVIGYYSIYPKRKTQ